MDGEREVAVTTPTNDFLNLAVLSHSIYHIRHLEVVYQAEKDIRVVRWRTKLGNKGEAPMDGSLDQFQAMLIAMKLTD